VNRYQGLDPRMSMAMAGGVMGIVLIAVLFTLRPVIGPSGSNLTDSQATFAPPPFEVLGPEGLFAAYEELGSVTVGGRAATLSVSRAEDLVLTSGRILASDAFFLDTPPFSVMLPAGRHHVLLLHVTDAGGSSVAAAMVRAGGGRPVRWEGARTPAQSTSEEPFAYGVDSGTGSFASPEAVGRLRSLPEDVANALVDGLIAAYGSGPDYKQTAAMTVDPASGANVVTFTSGYGDGGYASWFGFDASGNAVALLTSFDLIDDPTKPMGSSAP
jgi:hypothetical protein